MLFYAIRKRPEDQTLLKTAKQDHNGCLRLSPDGKNTKMHSCGNVRETSRKLGYTDVITTCKMKNLLKGIFKFDDIHPKLYQFTRLETKLLYVFKVLKSSFEDVMIHGPTAGGN